MSAELRLNPTWSAVVRLLGETGMGYTTVRVTTRQGRVYPRVQIIQQVLVAEVDGSETIPFTNDDIVAIERI